MLLAEVLNADLDRIVAMIQQLRDAGADNTVFLDAGSEGLPLPSIPASTIAERDNKVISFNDAGQPVLLAPDAVVQDSVNAAASSATSSASSASLSLTRATDSDNARIASVSAKDDAVIAKNEAEAAAETGAATGVATALTTDQEWTGEQTLTNIKETELSSAVSFTPNLDNGSVFKLTAAGTITMPTAEMGKSFTVIVPAGTHVTWSGVKWSRGSEPTKGSGIDIYSFLSDGTDWFAGQAGTNFA